MSLVVAAAAFAGCNGDPQYADPIRSADLGVVPDAALASFEAGQIDADLYSMASSDAFQDGSYVIKDTPSFKLDAYNNADPNQKRLEIQGNSSGIASGVNDIANYNVVISTPDASKISMLMIEGKTLLSTDFTWGTPTLVDGSGLDSGSRLPGYFAVVKLGALAAKQASALNVSVAGKQGLELHFDAFGNVWGGRVLTTGAHTGTTFINTIPDTYMLAASKTGNGSGQVVSSPLGIDCGTQCAAMFARGSSVTLAANAANGSSFTGWSGACNGTGPCTVTMDSAKNVSANFALNSYPLMVTKSGLGQGAVSSAPAGIDCGANCAASYDYGTMVTLTATPAVGAVFTGWTGDCAGASNTCQVTISKAMNVNANFDIAQFGLSVSVIGGGTGSVVSSPSGISCSSSSCSANFNYNTSVTLVASANAGMIFQGWSGACASAGSNPACTVTITAAASASADFEVAPPPPVPQHTLTVTKSGSASGSVTSAPAGIDCGASCSALFYENSSVTLVAVPAVGATFTGWSGACTGTNPTCTFTVGTTDMAVNANFDIAQYAVSVAVNGAGSGSVSSNPAGISSCRDNCSANFNYGTNLTLTATPDTGSVFLGWSGVCSGTDVCTINVSQASSVVANFGIASYLLSVAKTGLGNGRVVSSPDGIDCGSSCSAYYDYNTPVTLTAIADVGVNFTGWSGACSGTSLTCTVTVTQAASVTANFDIAQYSLSVVSAGNGTITSSPSGISCDSSGNGCSANFNYGTSVTLTATPGTGQVFSGWSGACSGSGPTCTITINDNTSVGANFGVAVYSLAVSKIGSGTGTVSSDNSINCGTSCLGQYQYGTTITLTATPSVGQVFNTWSGACASAGSNPTCVVTMDAAKSVTARFDIGIYAVTLTKSGTGSGTVTSDSGLSCGSNCSASYPYGTTITLTAASDPTNPYTIFTGWTGACDGSTALSCTFTVTGPVTVNAAFDTITQINITLDAGKIYSSGVYHWGIYTMPQRGNISVPSTVNLVQGNTGNQYAMLDFNGATVCCYNGANGHSYTFTKCIDGTPFGSGTQPDSIAMFNACKSSTTPTVGVTAGSSIQLPRGGTITLLMENGDGRNPSDGSPNFQGVINTVINVLAWFQP